MNLIVCLSNSHVSILGKRIRNHINSFCALDYYSFYNCLGSHATANTSVILQSPFVKATCILGNLWVLRRCHLPFVWER